jgi:hypothetical protein
MKIKKLIQSELSITEEVLANTDANENLKFKFDFRRYFPEEGMCILKDRNDKKDNSITFVDKRLYQLPTGTDPYYQMQVDLQVYYQDAVFRSSLFGGLKMERAILRWLESKLSKRQLGELKPIIDEFKRVGRLKYAVNEHFCWKIPLNDQSAWWKVSFKNKMIARDWLRKNFKNIVGKGHSLHKADAIKEVFKKPKPSKYKDEEEYYYDKIKT